jgi:hypothetical protein
MKPNLANWMDEGPRQLIEVHIINGESGRVRARVVKMQHHLSSLISRGVCWLVLHDPMENIRAEIASIEMLCFWKDLNI